MSGRVCGNCLWLLLVRSPRAAATQRRQRVCHLDALHGRGRHPLQQNRDHHQWCVAFAAFRSLSQPWGVCLHRCFCTGFLGARGSPCRLPKLCAPAQANTFRARTAHTRAHLTTTATTNNNNNNTCPPTALVCAPAQRLQLRQRGCVMNCKPVCCPRDAVWWR